MLIRLSSEEIYLGNRDNACIFLKVLSVVGFVWVEAGLRCEVYFVPDKSRMQNLIKISISGFSWLGLLFEARSFVTGR